MEMVRVTETVRERGSARLAPCHSNFPSSPHPVFDIQRGGEPYVPVRVPDLIPARTGAEPVSSFGPLLRSRIAGPILPTSLTSRAREMRPVHLGLWYTVTSTAGRGSLGGGRGGGGGVGGEVQKFEEKQQVRARRPESSESAGMIDGGWGGGMIAVHRVI